MKKKQPSFENQMNELETLVQTLEQGSSSLDESLLAFEKGVKLIRGLKKKLSAAEQKVYQVLENGDTTPFHTTVEEDEEDDNE